ncbi:hypothetical protein Tco_0703158 [Tanacetum coccineum]|uniref:Uncharacterized protein n=1 Tax=Tanacetum coccineum TaxID=301880 RepID=A0ABQ4XZW1_9ASTR
MSITGVLGRGWGSPTEGSRIDLRNNRKDRHDQAKDASSSGSTKELCRSEMKADGVRWSERDARESEVDCTLYPSLAATLSFQQFSNIFSATQQHLVTYNPTKLAL